MKEELAVKRAAAEKKWRAEMKELGRDVVQQRFNDRFPITDSMPYPDAAFVQNWLWWRTVWSIFRTGISSLIVIAGAIAGYIKVWTWLH